MLSEADRLNGVDWIVRLSYRYELVRFTDGYGVWSDWYSADRFDGSRRSFLIRKKGGQVEVGLAAGPDWRPVRRSRLEERFTCEEALSDRPFASE